MEAFILEWLGLVLRWLHIVTGIAWVGSSFYFMWLDSHIMTNPPRTEEEAKTTLGTLWSIHGGGFYFIKKFRGAPSELPETLHWFKWEAYFTWISGFLLLAVLYYWNAEIYLIDSSKISLLPYQAILISLAFFIACWCIYHYLCRSPLKKFPKIFIALLVILAIALAFILTQIFNARGAYIHFGAIMGTIMAANVFFVIIPNQKKIVAALVNTQEPPLYLGAEGKQRSVHNNYLTLPVIFLMMSNHYPSTFGHPYNWIILLAVSGVGILVRHFFNLRNSGKISWSLFPLATVLMIIIIAAAYITQKKFHTTSTTPIKFSQVRKIIDQRCAVCHSQNPTFAGFELPPKNIAYDTRQQIEKYLPNIISQAVTSQAMPLGNITNMTDEERKTLALWAQQLKK